MSMDTEELSFPLTKSNSQIGTGVKATQPVPENREPASSKKKQKLTISDILKRMVMAFGRGAESSQYYYLTRTSEKDEDETEPDPNLDSGTALELDSCSL